MDWSSGSPTLELALAIPIALSSLTRPLDTHTSTQMAEKPATPQASSIGSALEHRVYKAEGVGLVMGLHLLNGLNHQLTQTTVMGTDSQAVIRALGNRKSHAGQYILDAIHNAAEQLHAKQDRLINREDRAWEIENGRDLIGCK